MSRRVATTDIDTPSLAMLRAHRKKILDLPRPSAAATAPVVAASPT